MTRRLRLLVLTLAIAAAIAALAVFGLASRSTTGRLAPALPREHLAGPPVTLSSLLAGTGGRPALVVFWASWCDACAEEAPALERFSQSRVGRGRIVGVDWSDAASGARAFIKHYGWTFPTVRDAEGMVGNAYRIPNLPTTFVINAHSRISRVLHGPQSEHSLQAALAAVERS
jgi:cytochrome c biogenesis protein CcmG, thiol:disulfide interchange protein DsbE